MLKEIILTEDQKQLNQDIQYLLSSIRARQNCLIFFLQHFSSTPGSQSPQQFRMYKNQFLQKQRIYTTQVNDIFSKYKNSNCKFDTSHHLFRGFWLKLKSILKVSLQRIKILELLNQRIFQRYDSILTLINQNYDSYQGLQGLKEIQSSLKKRNIDALIIGKNHINQYSDTKVSKNRSEKLLMKSSEQLSSSIDKHQSQMQTPPILKSNKKNKGINIGMSLGDGRDEFGKIHPNVNRFVIPDNNQINPQREGPHPRLKSLNRYNTKAKKTLENIKRKTNSVKTCQKHYKKYISNNIIRFTKNVQKYQKNIQGVMDGKLDINFDKKKTIFENVYAIYDNLFDKNIGNHKSISKFIYTSCGLNNLINFNQKKFNRKVKSNNNNNRDTKQSVKEKEIVTEKNLKAGEIPPSRTSSKINKNKKKIEEIDSYKRAFQPQKLNQNQQQLNNNKEIGNKNHRSIKSSKFTKKAASLFGGNQMNHRTLLTSSKII